MPRYEFPADFLWGAATASYQIEGAVDVDGRAPSVWDTFSATPGAVANGDTGAVACDHYHRYKEDVALMSDMGLHAYRFSIAWPRILPAGVGEVNAAGLDFYDRLVDELLSRQIEPWATLYHWDLPQALEDLGGWTHRAIVDAFANYADVVTQRLGDRVKRWMTLNEPWVFCYKGYGDGAHAPGRASFGEYLQAAHHALMAHGAAVPIVRANSPDSQVGVAVNMAWSDPATDSDDDKAAAHAIDGFYNRWFLDPIYKGEYPEDMRDLYAFFAPGVPEIQDGDMAQIQGKPDFLGINFYFRFVVTHDASLNDGGEPLLPDIHNVHQPDSRYTAMGWEVSPQAIYDLLMQTTERYNPGAIYITENGAAFDDQLEDGAVHDPDRVSFYQGYIANCHRAIEEAAPLDGFFAWSLLDNFEWSEGYNKRFGITYVNYETQQRILKSSGQWYAQTIADNGFDPT